MNKRTNPLERMLKGIWGAIDATRKVAVNLLFLAIVIVLLVVVFSDDDPDIADTTALVDRAQGAARRAAHRQVHRADARRGAGRGDPGDPAQGRHRRHRSGQGRRPGPGPGPQPLRPSAALG